MEYVFKLFIDEATAASSKEVHCVRELCASKQRLTETLHLDIIDVNRHPELAEKENILATPTLIRYAPLPKKKVIGSLASNHKLAGILKPDGDRRPLAEPLDVPLSGELSSRQLLELNPDGVVLLDDEGTVLFTNPAGARLFDNTPDAMRGTLFGFPLVEGEAAELCIGRERFAEMRVVRTR